MSDEELSEIVNASQGRYRQELVEGAKDELKRREHDGARAESPVQVVTYEAPPPSLSAGYTGGKLYSTGQITLATFLGAPVAGCLLLARNYQVLGKGGAWQPLVVGAVTTILLVVIGLLLPENVPGTGLSAGGCIGMYYYAKQWQGGAIDANLKAGARQGSWLAVVLLGVSSLVVLFGLFIALAIAFDPGTSTEREALNGPVARVRVSQAGQIEMNGVQLNREELRRALARLRAEGGRVMYYRERWNEPPSAEAAKAFEVIRDAGLPVRMSSKPDFSDYIGPDGVPVPTQ
jgi:hypothetical protein